MPAPAFVALGGSDIQNSSLTHCCLAQHKSLSDQHQNMIDKNTPNLYHRPASMPNTAHTQAPKCQNIMTYPDPSTIANRKAGLFTSRASF